MFNKLTCNYRKCRKVLDQYAVACSCSHIFCEEHCPTNFGGSTVKCLACKMTLNQEKMDVIPVELEPNERFKSMVLAGQKPEIILDVCSRALAFWMYQSQQEIDYNVYISKRLSDKCKTVEDDSRNLAAVMQQEKCNLEMELQRVNKKCEEMREKLIELSQRYQQLELESKTMRSHPAPPSSNESISGGPEKKKASFGFSNPAENSFRNNPTYQTESKLKRSNPKVLSSFHKNFFNASHRRFVSPDSTRASPADQRLCQPGWMMSQQRSCRSDPESASLINHLSQGRMREPHPPRSTISSAFRCGPAGLKS